MTSEPQLDHERLLTAVLDESFPELDLALRQGRHVDREDGPWYALLLEYQDALEGFYRRYGCELVHRSDGYFYLLPTGGRLRRRKLSAPEMVVGQGLALLYLDPQTAEHGGATTRADLLHLLATVMTSDGLSHAMGYKRRRADERVAQQFVRRRVAGALRRLAALGFVETPTDETLRLRPALLRFAEPVRGAADALERLLASGEVVMEEGGEETEDGDGEDEDGDDEAEAEAEPEPEEAVDEAEEEPVLDWSEPLETDDGEDEPPS